MKIHNLNEIPRGYNNYDLRELSDYGIEDLEKLELDEIWYWYAIGFYEGVGQILMRKGNLYDVHECGHCSCYGPTEYVEFNGQKISDIKKNCSDEYLNKLKPLLDFRLKTNKESK